MTKEPKNPRQVKARLPSVFIGSSSEGREIAEHLQAVLEGPCEPTVWSQGLFGLGAVTLQSLVRAVHDYDFAVLVLSADDVMVKRGQETHAPRDNVIFEAGMFFGGLGPDRTFLVHCSDDRINLPSDLAGITTGRYKSRQDNNLRAALSPVALQVKEAIAKHGVKTPGPELVQPAVHDLHPSEPASRQRLTLTEARAELIRELDVLSRSLQAQGWKLKTRSESAFRVVSPQGDRHSLSIGDPWKTREELRPFARRLRDLGVRISKTLLE